MNLDLRKIVNWFLWEVYEYCYVVIIYWLIFYLFFFKKNVYLGDEFVIECICNVCNLDEIYFLLKCIFFNDYIGDFY